MPKRIPIATAKAVAEKHGLRQVLLIGYDGERVHVVTYGVTKDDCEKAAIEATEQGRHSHGREQRHIDEAIIQRAQQRQAHGYGDNHRQDGQTEAPNQRQGKTYRNEG